MDIKPQSTNYSARAAFHARAAEGVRAKIAKHLVIDGAELQLPYEPWVEKLQRTYDAAISSDKWRTRRNEVLQSTTEKPDIDTLDKTARGILERYAEAFYLHSKMYSRREYMPDAHRKYSDAVELNYYLWSILTNHLANQAEAELTAIGCTQADAHRLHSRLIGIAIGDFKQCAPSPLIAMCAEISPQIGSASGKSDTEIDNRISRIRGTWKKELAILQREHARFTKPDIVRER